MTDISALAAAVASQIGGTIRPAGDDADDAPSGRDIAWIDLHDKREGLRVGYGAERTRVRATMTQTMASRDGAHYQETPNFRELTTAAAISRGADVIARQIESKIIPPALPMLEAWKVKRAGQKVEASRLESAVARYREAFPSARIGDDGKLWMSDPAPGGAYVTGRIDSDGGFYVERMSTMRESLAFPMLRSIKSGAFRPETIS